MALAHTVKKVQEKCDFLPYFWKWQRIIIVGAFLLNSREIDKNLIPLILMRPILALNSGVCTLGFFDFAHLYHPARMTD
jgi:hypothetical protein